MRKVKQKREIQNKKVALIVVIVMNSVEIEQGNG